MLLGPAKYQRVPGNSPEQGEKEQDGIIGAGKQGMRQEKLIYLPASFKAVGRTAEGLAWKGKEGKRARNERAELQGWDGARERE